MHIYIQGTFTFFLVFNFILPYFFTEFWDIGDASFTCSHCGACFWFEERLGKPYKAKNPKYSHCCMNGNIQIPNMISPPELLRQLMFSNNLKSTHYLKNIRSYNSMFGFTSMGGKVDNSINTGRSPPVFRLHGQNYHLIGSLLPSDGCDPKFAQLYIYDTENEVNNRIKSVGYVFLGATLKFEVIKLRLFVII